MDLGLELNRPPTGMKGEAVIGFSELNVRSKRREEAEMKEFGWMDGDVQADPWRGRIC